MRNLLMSMLLVFSTALMFSQEDEKSGLFSNLSPYVAAGVSIADGDFSTNSYPSVEVGVDSGTDINLSLSGVFGRGNFEGMLASDDSINYYWYEIKAQVSTGILNDLVDIYGLLGAGQFIGNNDGFFEYGGGLSKSLSDRWSVFVQYSNWNEDNYVTPGVKYSL